MIEFNKEAQVDVTKELKPASEKFKDPGQKEKLILNPKPDEFSVPDKVQQKIDKKLGEKYKTKGEDIPMAGIKPVKAAIQWFKKKADEIMDKAKKVDPGASQFKDPGQKEKLIYPTKMTPTPEPKQPGLDIDKEAKTKTYKDPGIKENLIYPTKPADLPDPEIVVAQDKVIGSEYKDEGEKEKVLVKPKPFTVPVSQPKSDVSPEEYMHAYEKAKPIQKQFEYAGINWFKRSSEPAKMTEEAREFISKKIKTLMDEGYPQEQAIAIAYQMARDRGFDVPEPPKSAAVSAVDVLLRFAEECPECFHRLVSIASQSLYSKAALSPEESKELAAIADAASKGTLTPAQRTRLEELKTKAINNSITIERKADEELLDSDISELTDIVDIDNFNEMYCPEMNDITVQAAAKRPPMKALKKLWEESDRSKEKCIKKLKDEPFLKVKKGETREDAAARFCRWLEMKMEGKAKPTRGPRA